MLALAKEIITWGMISDDFNLGVNDMSIGILASGRIGTGKDFLNNVVKPYTEKKRNEQFDQQIDEFIETDDKESDPKSSTKEDEKRDAAFLAEFGIKRQDLISMIFYLQMHNLEQEQPCAVFDQDELVKLIVEDLELPVETILSGLNALCLDNRKSWPKLAAEYKKADIYPWKYNRALSLIRKPIVR
ncbi:hypothetical protein EON78_02190, partial [bacterium]